MYFLSGGLRLKKASVVGCCLVDSETVKYDPGSPVGVTGFCIQMLIRHQNTESYHDSNYFIFRPDDHEVSSRNSEMSLKLSD